MQIQRSEEAQGLVKLKPDAGLSRSAMGRPLLRQAAPVSLVHQLHQGQPVGTAVGQEHREGTLMVQLLHRFHQDGQGFGKTTGWPSG